MMGLVEKIIIGLIFIALLLFFLKSEHPDLYDSINSVVEVDDYISYMQSPTQNNSISNYNLSTSSNKST